jgi:sugar O-acyltransferase (sialic acid O-acetyltransferase NeuD family)
MRPDRVRAVSESIVIVGCGGHGREVYGIINDLNEAHGQMWKVRGFVDDGPSDLNLQRLERLGVSFLGSSRDLLELEPEVRYVIGIGDPKIRAAVSANLASAGRQAATLIHPAATVGLDTTIGEGSVLFAGARVTTNVTLGRHVHINQNATVGHDSVLADFVSVNPLAAVSGDCQLQKEVMIGTTAAVLQGLTVGMLAVVGAGACVVRDVPSESVVKGVPAR